MASGWGFSGGQGRCFPYWQEFKKCALESEDPIECSLLKDDYIECLHNKKEKARAREVQIQMVKNAQRDAKEGHKQGEIIAGGVVTGLGLIKPPENKEKEGGKK